jgi:hypothetical protein
MSIVPQEEVEMLERAAMLAMRAAESVFLGILAGRVDLTKTRHRVYI